MATMERLGNFAIGFLMASINSMPSFRSLGLHHGLEEAPVIHQLGPGHLEGVRQHFIGFLMANVPNLHNFRSLGPSHGLEEAPVGH